MWTVNVDICADQDVFPFCYTDLAEVRQNFEACENVEELPSQAVEEQSAQSTGINFDDICALLAYYATSCGNCLPTFRDNVSVRVRKKRVFSFLLVLLIREDGTDTLSRNVGKQLPHDVA
jgi:hypothetical protein